jgi:hypothetical protein
MVTFRILLTLVVLWPVSSVAEDYLDGLIKQKSELESVISRNSKYGIYAASELEVELSLIERFLFEDKVGRKITELKAAGKKFLVFLEDTDDSYNSLDVEDWLAVADLLLEIDDLVSKKIAWGNLIIKIAICNKIFYWMFDYIDSRNGIIELDVYNKLLTIHKRLREHCPSNKTMLYIALRYYGISTNLHVANYGLDVPYSEELEILEKELRSNLGGMSKVMDLVKSFSEKESKVTIGSYVELYDNPVPWATSFSTDYFHDYWYYYAYLMTVVRSSSLKASKMITEEELYEFYQKEYSSEAKFWMPRNAVRLVERPDIFLKKNYKLLKQESLIDKIRRDRKSIRQRESAKGDRLRTSKLW